jgi:pimeloyl-ACP methyl ester carboxylesterase
MGRRLGWQVEGEPGQVVASWSVVRGPMMTEVTPGRCRTQARATALLPRAPGSRLEAGLLAAPAGQLGIRLIGVDRPGLGVSTYQPRRRLLDWPRDITALADHLALHWLAVLGLSGGGSYALACARSIRSD